MKRYLITGIGTGIGKTLVSAVLTEALKADYFKPIQCGNLDELDSDFVREHLFNSKSKIHSENFLLKKPASPHDAAKAENKEIRLKDFSLPATQNTLLIEGAGGMLVPLNERKEYVIDFAKKFDAEVILVTDYYLGSINHTLLSLNFLKAKKLKPALVVFNGDKVEGSKQAILKEMEGVPFVEIERFEVNPDSVKQIADQLSDSLSKILL